MPFAPDSAAQVRSSFTPDAPVSTAGKRGIFVPDSAPTGSVGSLVDKLTSIPQGSTVQNSDEQNPQIPSEVEKGTSPFTPLVSLPDVKAGGLASIAMNPSDPA